MLGVPIMSPASLKTKLSEWENGRSGVSEVYQRLFRDIYGLTSAELGFAPGPDEIDDDTADLRSRLAVARLVDAGTVELFRTQLEAARRMDRQFGGITLLDQLRGTLDQIQVMLAFGARPGQREPLATVLAETAALAGWEALDRNAVAQAWTHHERAKAAAREAGSDALLAHATAQQAFILIDIGDNAEAADQLAHARALAERSSPALLRGWAAAAHGEGLAAVGDRNGALRAFEAAEAVLPDDPADPALPYLFLAGAHLERWRGHALSRLGDAEAITSLSAALPRLPVDFTRARTGLLVDLAHAHAAAGNRDEALAHARDAKRLARQIKSDRQLRRLAGLVLPGRS